MGSRERGKGSLGKPGGKRAEPPLRSDYTARFLKDWTRIGNAGRQDLWRAKRGMNLLISNDGPLPPEYRDHPLAGRWKNHREFHAGGDLLVIYTRSEGSITFERIGTHTELFD